MRELYSASTLETVLECNARVWALHGEETSLVDSFDH